MNAIKPLMGMAKSLLPVGAGKILPVQPKLPNFGSFLSDFIGLLQELTGGSSEGAVKSGEETPELAPETETSRESEPLRDFSPADSRVREADRREEKEEVEETPYEGISLQIDEVRRLMAKMDAEVQAETPPAAPSPQLPVETDLQKGGFQASFEGLQAPPEEIAPPAPPVKTAPPTLTEELAPPAPPPAPSRLDALPSSAPKIEDMPEFKVMETSQAPDAQVDTAPPAPPAIPPGPVLAQAVGAAVVRAETSILASAPQDDILPGAGDSRTAEGRPMNLATETRASSAEERAEFVERIVRAARLTQSRGASRIKIALNPPHLGNLRVDLSVKQGVLNGTIQAETVAAKDLLQSNLQALKEALAAQGVNVGELQVSVNNNAFQQASRDADGGRAPRASRESTRSRAEERFSAIEGGLRSVRLQLIDVVV